jgi:hypothetical protein
MVSGFPANQFDSPSVRSLDCRRDEGERRLDQRYHAGEQFRLGAHLLVHRLGLAGGIGDCLLDSSESFSSNSFMWSPFYLWSDLAEKTRVSGASAAQRT